MLAIKINGKTTVFLILAAMVVFGAALWVVGSIQTAPHRERIGDLPADLQGRNVEFPGGSGSNLHGWFLPGKTGAGAVILMHGVRSNRLRMIDRARFLARAGYSVLLFDFQAHGESSGSAITFGYLESRDAQAAVEYVRNILPEEKIGVIGASLGGAATILASPPLDVKAMVLESVYPTIDDAVSNRVSVRLGRWAGSLAPLLTIQFRPRLGISANQLRPIDHVGNTTIPKLFLAGSKDRHTTIDESRRMFDRAAGPKEFWVINGAAHVDLYQFAPEEYERRILVFLNTNLREKRTV